MLRILLADGDFLSAELLALTLKFAGFDICRAHDAEQALQQARESQPSAILINVGLAGFGGCELTRVLRADPRCARVPVVLFGSADEVDVAWREAGADAFLQKPIDVRRLPELVRSLCPSQPTGKVDPPRLAMGL